LFNLEIETHWNINFSFIENNFMSYSSLKRASQNYYDCTDQLWDWYSQLSESDRQFVIEKGSWSVNDVFYHLMAIEEMLLRQVRNRLISPNIKKAGWSHRKNAALLFIALWLPKKYKAPSTVSVQDNQRTFDLENWKLTRLEFQELILNFPKEHKASLVFKHPLAGPLLMHHGIKFLTYHMKHHFRQLRVISKSGGFEAI
jgi:hypothetical protein